MLRTPWKRFALILLAGAGSVLGAQETPEPPEEIRISRAAGPIEVDGSLGDAGWSGATRVDTFYEINIGDNVTPPVKTVAWIAYDGDDRALSEEDRLAPARRELFFKISYAFQR